MNFEKSYGVLDPKKAAKWFKSEEGGEFLIAPLGNLKQVEENLKLMKIKDSSDEETYHDVKLRSCSILAKSVLLDWKEVEDSSGKQLPYNFENGTNILYHYEGFRGWVVEKASELVKEQADLKETVTKN